MNVKRVLIIDDAASSLHFLQSSLHQCFSNRLIVEAFAEPEAALLRCGEVGFDVVISDYNMPGISGADVLRFVKGLQPDAARIMLCDLNDYAGMLDMVSRVGWRCITKPVALDRLCETLLQAFFQHNSSDQKNSDP